MLVANNRLLFIHVPKTAGTSVRRMLLPYSKNRGFSAGEAIGRALNLRRDARRSWYQMHDTAAFVIGQIGRAAWDTHVSFSIVRNPYTHAYSHWRYIQGYKYRRYQDIARAASLAEFLQLRLDHAGRRWQSRVAKFAYMGDQTSFISDEAGQICVTRTVAFEALAEQLPPLLQEHGIDGALPHLRSGAGHAADYAFSAQETALIEKLYARDFDNFGYARRPMAP